jgi:hypothetical protein
VFGPNGDLFVSSAHTNQVLEYNGTTGAFDTAFVSVGSGGLVGPNGLVFGPNGDLFVSGGNSQVLEYNGTTGTFDKTFVSMSSGGLNSSRDLVFGPNGDLFVSSEFTNQVLEYDGTTGAFDKAFVAMGSGGLSFPQGLVFGPNGDLFVSSFSQTPPPMPMTENSQVLEYNGTTGAFDTTFVSVGSGGLDVPTYLTFGPSPLASTPEPSALSLMSLAFLGLIYARRLLKRCF